MSRRFIQLYLDEDVDVRVGAIVRARGFEATASVEAGQRGRGDEEQLVFATERGMSLLTHNRRDFDELARRYVDSGRHHAGIIIAVRRPARELARRLLVVLNEVTAEEMDDQVRYV